MISFQNAAKLRTLRAASDGEPLDEHQVTIRPDANVVCLHCGLRGPADDLSELGCDPGRLPPGVN